MVWRSPAAIQFGGHRPVVVLDPVSPAEERMLGALERGVPEASLAAQARCTHDEAAHLLSRLDPVLRRPPASPNLSITLRARDAQTRRLADAAGTLGLLGPQTDGEPLVAGIVAGAYAIPAIAYRDWLRDDIPHLGIVFRETDVLVSQVVVPGVSPCLRCADLHHRDEDACWPAVAAQLVTRTAAAADDPVLVAAAITTAVRALRQTVLGGAPMALARGIRLAPDGSLVEFDAPAHPECGCLADLQRSAVIEPTAG